jgi:rubrerythrin
MGRADYLLEALAEECLGNIRYLAFAKKADVDKLPQIAKMFRAAAAAEAVHANSHLRALGQIAATNENLKHALKEEHLQNKILYPQLLATAETDKNIPASVSIRNAMTVEDSHHKLFLNAIQAVEQGCDLPDIPFYVCALCGNTIEGSRPEKCSVCNAVGEKFSKID